MASLWRAPLWSTRRTSPSLCNNSSSSCDQLAYEAATALALGGGLLMGADALGLLSYWNSALAGSLSTGAAVTSGAAAAGAAVTTGAAAATVAASNVIAVGATASVVFAPFAMGAAMVCGFVAMLEALVSIFMAMATLFASALGLFAMIVMGAVIVPLTVALVAFVVRWMSRRSDEAVPIGSPILEAPAALATHRLYPTPPTAAIGGEAVPMGVPVY